MIGISVSSIGILLEIGCYVIKVAFLTNATVEVRVVRSIGDPPIWRL
jgi:hypothetical protein